MKYDTLRGILLATVTATLFSQPVFAQTASNPQPNTPAPASEPVPGVVALADFVTACAKGARPETCPAPRAARPSTISEDTPMVTHDAFIKYYPQAGEEGYKKIAAANKSLCDDVSDDFIGMQSLDEVFKISDRGYDTLTDIFNALPPEVKLHTRVMEISQVGQAGALCLLSSGLYCIAAAVGAAGNIFSAESNLDLQLASIKLSIANIVVTRANIYSNRISLRLDGRWLKMAYPMCRSLGYDTPSGLSVLGPVPTFNPDTGAVQPVSNSPVPQPAGSAS